MKPLLALVLALSIAGCGGSSSSAPPSESTTTRPVRVDDPGATTTPEASAGPRPVRVAPTVPGEAAESEELADPPPVEAPTH